jgi:hypothetical protein
MPRHREVLVNHQSALLGVQADAADQRVRADTDAPDKRVGGHEAVVRQLNALGGRLLHRGAHQDFDAPLPQHLVGAVGQSLVEFGQHSVGDVEQ